MSPVHAREQIVESLFQVIRAISGWNSPPRYVGATSTQVASIPTADIRALDESSEELSRTQEGHTRELRELSVGVTIYAVSLEERGSFALEVETNIALSEAIGRTRRLSSSQFEIDDGEFPVFVARQVYVVEYHIHRLEPSVIITSG